MLHAILPPERALTLTLVALLGAQSGLLRTSSLLCLGASGHISVEPMAASCCGAEALASGTARDGQGHLDDATSVSETPGLESEDSSCCGDCTDFPLFPARTERSASSLVVPILTLADASLEGWALMGLEDSSALGLSDGLARSLERPPPHPPRGALAHLAAVILRR